jgi:hypothetical protein
METCETINLYWRSGCGGIQTTSKKKTLFSHIVVKNCASYWCSGFVEIHNC